jgi:hypothetical protein
VNIVDDVVADFQKDGVVVQRGAAGSPPFPHLNLPDGAPFDAPEFPLIYPVYTPADGERN